MIMLVNNEEERKRERGYEDRVNIGPADDRCVIVGSVRCMGLVGKKLASNHIQSDSLELIYSVCQVQVVTKLFFNLKA